MSNFEENPFAHEEAVNPFSEAVSPRHDFGNAAPNPFSSNKKHQFRNESLENKEKRLDAKENELQKKEQELKRKEEDLKRREAALRGQRSDRNWPPFFPLIRHDVTHDIPQEAQRMIIIAFISFIGVNVCILWDFISVCTAWFRNAPGLGLSTWFVSLIYVICGCPGSYVLWYKPLYHAARTDSALKFGCFFLIYLVHIAFCCVIAIGPPFNIGGRSMTGILQALDLFTNHAQLAGIMYIVGFAIFTLEALLSIWVLKDVYMYFRGQGRSAIRRMVENTRNSARDAI